MKEVMTYFVYRLFASTYLCAISLLRVWIDFIDSNGTDWKRFPDISNDISEWAIKLQIRMSKKKKMLIN